MFSVESFLAQGEQIVEQTPITESGSPGGEPDMIIHTVANDGVRCDDEVLLEIRATDKPVAPCVLIGGEPLNLTVESGMGRLVMMSLDRGKDEPVVRENVELVPGFQATVHPDNRLYWYETDDPNNPLVVRDHCDNFDGANKPPLQAVNEAVTAALRMAFVG